MFLEEFLCRQAGQKSQRLATLADNLIPVGSNEFVCRGSAGEAACRGGERGGSIEHCCLNFQYVCKSFQLGIQHAASEGAADIEKATACAADH